MSIHSERPKLFLSAPHSCPYLKAQTASTVLLDPQHKVDRGLYSLLLNVGFRRSGKTIYRPHCGSCNACVSVRIPVDAFRPNRAQRRAYARNADLTTRLLPASFVQEHFELYCRYQAKRHSGDIMDHADPKLYREFMVDSAVATVFIECRLGSRLVALCVCDLVEDGMSAVYTFFDPDLGKRSLGSYAILKQIDYVRDMQLDWLYLGYWIEDCRKMVYKSDFKPLYGFVDREWQVISS